MKEYFLHQIKRTNRTIEKGIVVKDSFEAAKQGYHAYLSAYAYGHDPDTDYVQCMITGASGSVLLYEIWMNSTKPEPEA